MARDAMQTLGVYWHFYGTIPVDVCDGATAAMHDYARDWCVCYASLTDLCNTARGANVSQVSESSIYAILHANAQKQRIEGDIRQYIERNKLAGLYTHSQRWDVFEEGEPCYPHCADEFLSHSIAAYDSLYGDVEDIVLDIQEQAVCLGLLQQLSYGDAFYALGAAITALERDFDDFTLQSVAKRRKC